MIGSADLDEYYAMLDDMASKTTSDFKPLMQEHCDLLKEQIWLNQRVYALNMKLMGMRK